MLATRLHGHRRSILLLTAALALAGIVMARLTPVALFPAVHFPRIVVDVETGDRPAERMALEITVPIEQVLRSLPGVETVRSVTSRGECEVSVTFGWDQDLDNALLRTESSLGEMSSQLPAGTHFTVRRMDPTVFPCLACSVTSGQRSLAELRRLAWFTMRPVIATVPGVATIDVQGGAVEELQVVVDTALLAAHGMTADQLADSVAHANVQASLGRLEDHHKLYLLMADTETRSVAELLSIPVRANAGGIVHLSDVARVEAGTEPHWTRVTADGRDAVSLQIYQQPGGNTVAISDGIQKRIQELRQRLPSDVKVAVWYDQSQLITASAHSVRDAIVVGVGLAALVLLVALRSWRITVVALVAVPTVLATTMLAMRWFHLDFNIMTLGGMAAAVGLIIDDAIVMVEHLVARARAERSREAGFLVAKALEFAAPLAGSSAATVIIFLPLAFLSGVTGAFFVALSLTMAISLIASFLITLLAIPLVTVFVIGKGDVERKEGGFLHDTSDRAYRWAMTRLLRFPWLVLLAIVPICWAGWSSYRALGTGFMPSMDEGGFILDYRSAPGTSLTESDRILKQVESILRATPEVDTYSRRTGLQLGGGVTEANEGDFFVRLKSQPRRTCDEVMDDVRGRVQHEVPGLDIELLQLMEDLIGDLIANPHPIEIILSGGDGDALVRAASDVAKRIEQVHGVVDINNGVVVAGDSLKIQVDRDAAAIEGVDPTELMRQVQAAVSGSIVATIQRGEALNDVRVWLSAGSRSTSEQIERLLLHGPDGHLFPLSRVAALVPIIGQPQIAHIDLERVTAVTARISGRDLGSTISDLKTALDAPDLLPAGMTYRLGGIYAQQQQAFRDLATVLGSALILVFLLLVFLYESLRMALAMLLTTLLSLAGVMIGLRVTGMELNITALMGTTMVVGIVTEVGILFASAFVGGHAGVDRHERLIAAGLARLRPITMTVVAAALALAPLAIGLGEGSDMQRPLAIAIISGLLLQLPLVVIVLPMLLAWMRAR